MKRMMKRTPKPAPADTFRVEQRRDGAWSTVKEHAQKEAALLQFEELSGGDTPTRVLRVYHDNAHRRRFEMVATDALFEALTY